MSIKKTFVLTTAHTGIKVLAGIVMNKIIALYLGPAGLALIGQFQNFSGIVTSVGNGSIQTGIIKTTAECENEDDRVEVWSNALAISVYFSLITSVCVFTFAEYIAHTVMLSHDYIFVVQVFALSIVFYSLNLYVISILNGIGNIAFYSLINILISIFTLIVVSILTVYYKLNGALMGVIITQSFVFVISYSLIYIKYKNRFFKYVNASLNKSIIKQLMKFGLASFLSGFIYSIMMLSVRYIITYNSSLVEAGLWEATIKIGIYFNMFFAMPISIYFLPRFSGLRDTLEIKKLMRSCFAFSLPLLILFGSIVFLLKGPIIDLLFSSEFTSVKGLIGVLLIAELFRVTSGVFGVFFVANKLLYANIRNEFIWAVIFVIGVLLSFSGYGLTGVVVSYLISCLVWFLLNTMVFLSILRSLQKNTIGLN